jgi:uncharacterized protein
MNSALQYQNLLKRHGCSRDIIAHCVAVSKKALELTDALKFLIDKDLVLAGSILHDLGRCRDNGIEHVIEGATIARKEGFSDEVVRIIERHIGAGVTREEAEGLGLPPADYIPSTPEEVIVSYADNLTKGITYTSFPDALQRFKQKLGDDHPAVERFIKQHEQIQKWINKS